MTQPPSARLITEASLPALVTSRTGKRPVGQGELVINVCDAPYGAVADWNGTTGTDNSAAIQRAVDAATAGETIFFPRGAYKVSTAINITKAGLRFAGAGSITQNEGGSAYNGSSLVAAASGMKIFAYGDATVSGVGASGPQIEHLNFIAPTGITGAVGVSLRLVNYSSISYCSFRGLNRGIVVNSDNNATGGTVAGGDCSWNLFLQNHFRDCTTGLDIPYTGGTVTIGGSFNNCGTMINQVAGSQLRVMGTKSDGAPIVTSGQGALITNCTWELVNPAVHFTYNPVSTTSGQRNQVRNCFMIAADNTSNCVIVDAGCTDSVIDVTYANATLDTAVIDNGTRTRRTDMFGHFNRINQATPTTTTTTMLATSDIFLCDQTNAAGSGRNYTLWDATKCSGRSVTVMKTDVSANAANFFPKTGSGQTIAGAASFSLTNSGDTATFLSDGTNWLLQAFRSAAAAAYAPAVQVFTSSGTWTKPATCSLVAVTTIAGGGGGGSGRRGAAGSIRAGGGGGAGGGYSTRIFRASDLSATVAVTVGTAGAGGAAVTADDTSGNAGTNGTVSNFGSYLRAAGGVGGSGGTATTGTGGTAGGGLIPGGVGGAASTTGLVGGASPSASGTTGGGSGGGISTANVAAAGGASGALHTVDGSTGSAGAVDSTAPNTGSVASIPGQPGGGGGGGAASITTAAQAGAAGGIYGAGGGGGGASLNGFASGAGGAGAAGMVLVEAW